MQSGSTCQHTNDCRGPEHNTLPEQLYSELDAFIKQLPGLEGHLVTVLHKAQGSFLVICPGSAAVCRRSYGGFTGKGLWRSQLYTFFTMVPKGKHPISVCMGTACFVKGADKLVNALKEYLAVEVGEVTHDGLFSIDVCVVSGPVHWLR
jgi:NADP-reducing hydrogenase subunit HndA